MIQKVGMIGRGAIGVLFADLIQEKIGKENFAFICDEKRAENYRNNPVFCNGRKMDFQYVSCKEAFGPVDLLIIAVKGPVLEQSLESVRDFVEKDTVILSLLNGISSERIVEQELGQGIVLHSIAQLMDAVKLGNQVTYTKTGEIVIGTDDHKKKEALEETERFFRRIHFPHHKAEDVIHEQWSKLMLNCGINQVCAVYDVPYDGCQKPGKLRELFVDTMKEVQQIAKLEGIFLTDEEIHQWVDAVDRLSPQAMPSMRQDMLAGRKTEVELFSGTIMKLGKKHGVPVPVNEALYRKIVEKEKNDLTSF